MVWARAKKKKVPGGGYREYPRRALSKTKTKGPGVAGKA